MKACWRPPLLMSPSLFLLLLSPLLLADGAEDCPMNLTEAVPAGARLVGDVLYAGQPERPYGPSAYRYVQDGGYVLCTCTATKPCVNKCCKRNNAYVVQANGQNKCLSLNGSVPETAIDDFAVPKFVNASGTFGSYGADKFHLVYGKVTCSNTNNIKYRLEPFIKSIDNFRISEEGWLLNESGFNIVPPGQFCLEQFSEFDYQILPIVCDTSSVLLNNESGTNNIFYTVAILLSLPFLLTTFLVYALIRELQNLHGKSLMCHVATLLVAYTSLVVNQFATNNVNNEFCIILAYIMQFSFLASFFWLNVMCFDLWWTFSRLRPPRGNLKEYEAKKFIFYSIYSWGCTSLISIFTYCKDSWPDMLPSIARPEFGDEKCWFSSKMATVLYFYGPIGILLFSNLLMFIYTALMIVKHMRDAKVLNGRDSNRNVDHEKQRFMLYLKLFIVMGVNWLAEIISWAVESEVTSKSLWYVTDIGNALQGVLIFLIFVCKKRVLILLNKKLCPQYHFFKTSTSGSTRTTNSTFSRTCSTKIKDVVEMTSKNVQNSTGNNLQDFKL